VWMVALRKAINIFDEPAAWHGLGVEQGASLTPESPNPTDEDLHLSCLNSPAIPRPWRATRARGHDRSFVGVSATADH